MRSSTRKSVRNYAFRPPIAYECASGCCKISVDPAAKRGWFAIVTLNSKTGTFIDWSERLNRSERTLRSRVDRGLCMQGEILEKHPIKVQRAQITAFLLAQRFLMLPRIV